MFNCWILSLLVVAIVGIATRSHAFLTTGRCRRSLSRPAFQPTRIILYNAEEKAAAAEEKDQEDDGTANAAEETAVDAEEEEEEEEEEDPEVTKLKDEIEELESTLRRKTRQLREAQDTAEQYTKKGYAIKVAEMENMRRARSMMQSSDRSFASANVLREFLPVLDQLSKLKEQYDGDSFGQQYGALAGAFRGVFTELGVTEYTVSPGDPYDSMRMVAVESKHCEDQEKDTVLEPLSMGMELQGNVIRMAECAVSLGPEKTEEETTEETEASGEREDAAAEDDSA